MNHNIIEKVVMSVTPEATLCRLTQSRKLNKAKAEPRFLYCATVREWVLSIILCLFLSLPQQFILNLSSLRDDLPLLPFIVINIYKKTEKNAFSTFSPSSISLCRVSAIQFIQHFKSQSSGQFKHNI